MDIRVVRTKNAIRDAFFDLLVQKEIQDITLTEISAKANVNRQTIYNYYGGVHEILIDLVNTLFDYYQKSIRQIDIINSFETPMAIFNKINNIIQNNLVFYRKLFKMEHNLILKKNIAEELYRLISETFKKYKVFSSNDQADILTTYFVHGLLGSYSYYFNHEYLDLNEFSKYVGDLIFNGLKKQINIKK